MATNLLIPIHTAWTVEKKWKFTTAFLKVSRRERSKLIKLYSPTRALIANRDSLYGNGYDTHSVFFSGFAIYGTAASLCFTAGRVKVKHQVVICGRQL